MVTFLWAGGYNFGLPEGVVVVSGGAAGVDTAAALASKLVSLSSESSLAACEYS